MPRASLKNAPQQPVININTTPATPPEENEPEKPEASEQKAPRWFFDEIHSFPVEQWGKLWHMELHRMEPKIPGVPGSKGYLCMFLEPVTIEAIRQRYGGGKFRLNLCKNGRWFRSHDFDIEGQPIYDTSRERPNPNGGTGVPGADFQKEFISVLRDELQRSRESNQGQPPGTEKIIEMMSTASDKAMEIVAKQTPQASNPTQQLSDLVTTAKNLGLVATNAGGSNDLLTTLLVPLLKPLLEKLVTPPDPLAELTKLGAALDVLEKIRGGGSEAPPKDWKAALVSQAVQHIPQVIEAFKDSTVANTEAARMRAIEAENRRRAAEVLANRASQPTTTPPPAAASVSPTATAAAPPAPAVRANGGLETETIHNAPGATAAPDPALEAAAQQKQYDDAFKVQIVNMIRLGCSGETIAELIYDLKPEFCKDLARYTPEMITAFFSADPILKLCVEDPRWQEVLTHARDFILEEEAEESNQSATVPA